MMWRTKAELVRHIRAEWATIVRLAGVKAEALDALPARDLKLLGSSYKTSKSETRDVLTGVCYMAPADEAFDSRAQTLCKWSTPECRAVCLGAHAGRMVMTPVRRARLWKAALFLGRPDLWHALLDFEVRALTIAARKRHKVPAVRIDGSSDTGAGRSAARRHPMVEFYDYTKDRTRAAALAARPQHNYSLTYSWRGKRELVDTLPPGVNVAVVFAVKTAAELPSEWMGRKVIDGTAHDARFLDEQGIIVGLPLLTASNWEKAREAAGSFAVEV